MLQPFPRLAGSAASLSVLALALGVAGCAVQNTSPATTSPPTGTPASATRPLPGSEGYAWFNRVTWGATPSLVERHATAGIESYLNQQLQVPSPNSAQGLPAGIEAQIRSMTITQKPVQQLVQEMEQRRKDAEAIGNIDDKKIAQQSYQSEMNRLAKEAATRHVLRALYSPRQLQEKMTWFWMNHFNVHQYKSNLRAMVGDYEDAAIRPHALGKFKDLLAAVAHHPAMLRYLDNDQNAVGRINENYARELMELHTLGIDGGYSQADVQELARVLTGVGINQGAGTPSIRRDLQAFYVRQGLFEFNPARHDFGSKQLLGKPIQSKGLAEYDEALDRLSRHPATAHFVCRKLIQYWMSDDPPPLLVERLSAIFLKTDGDIAQTLHALLASAEFSSPSVRKFKDPMQYVVSAVRLAYDEKPILNANPMLNWLNRMGEPLYGHQTPDGYPMHEAAWASPGQMATRFEIAKAIGSGNAGLFRSEGPEPQERAAFPLLSNALYYQYIQKTLGDGTRKALDQAASAQEWNTFLLSSPEMMVR